MPSLDAAVPLQKSKDVSASHLVLIPSYNTGEVVYRTVKDALAQWAPVWVVVDGSTDGTAQGLQTLAASEPNLRVIHLQQNQGKGAAVLAGLDEAQRTGFTHALVMDSDGQHPAAKIAEFMQASIREPNALVLGEPVFDASAPLLRLRGRKVSNTFANLETLWLGIHDSLFGFRVYPIAPLQHIMQRSFFMRRFDFDVEAAVRLVWAGHRPVNVPAPCRYLQAGEGGVSHFHYLRDNLLLTGMHCRLLAGFVLRLPVLVARKIFLWR